MESNIHYGTVFDKTLKAYQSGKKIIIHQGGTGSGKTLDIMIFLIFMIALKRKDTIITVVSESKPHLDIGVIRISKDLLKRVGLFSESEFNISSGRYTFANGSIIEFFSADRIEKALGARRDWLFGNEINSLKFDIWDELARRSENIIGDFNPTSQFWLEKFLNIYGDHELIKTNYIDNPFLPDTERERIIRRASMDDNFRRIHIDCEYGIFEGLIFTDWQAVDEIPEGLKELYGLDFGYTNDPSVLIKVATKDIRLYADEVFYQTGLTNQAIRAMLSTIKPGNREIIADSSEPKSIDEIYHNKLDGLGTFNIKPAVKGPDSVIFGINRIKEHKLFITKRSTNLIKELRNYSWASDKNGNLLNKPIDEHNHGIDAIRYAITHRQVLNPKYMMG